MDISAFDFSAVELTELLVELAPVAKAIEVEPRLHQEDEMARTGEGWVKTHEGLTGPTFRIRCRLRGGSNVLEQFVALMSTLGVSSVRDHDDWVRVRHDPADIASGRLSEK
jgi:hypothetical protein